MKRQPVASFGPKRQIAANRSMASVTIGRLAVLAPIAFTQVPCRGAWVQVVNAATSVVDRHGVAQPPRRGRRCICGVGPLLHRPRHGGRFNAGLRDHGPRQRRSPAEKGSLSMVRSTRPSRWTP